MTMTLHGSLPTGISTDVAKLMKMPSDQVAREVQQLFMDAEAGVRTREVDRQQPASTKRSLHRTVNNSDDDDYFTNFKVFGDDL